MPITLRRRRGLAGAEFLRAAGGDTCGRVEGRVEGLVEGEEDEEDEEVGGEEEGHLTGVDVELGDPNDSMAAMGRTLSAGAPQMPSWGSQGICQGRSKEEPKKSRSLPKKIKRRNWRSQSS